MYLAGKKYLDFTRNENGIKILNELQKLQSKVNFKSSISTLINEKHTQKKLTIDQIYGKAMTNKTVKEQVNL